MSIHTFNKIFDIKPKISCLECDEPKTGEDSTINPNENEWYICKGCEEEVGNKLECFNTDCESGINYNLSNQY